MTRSQRTALLAPLRNRLRGWAFAPDAWLPSKLRDAEALVRELPEELQAEAESMIAPVRDAMLHQTDNQ
jgi:hypothetical protein